MFDKFVVKELSALSSGLGASSAVCEFFTEA
jgi:hypothetical protein